MTTAPALAASNAGHIAFASGDPSHIWTVKPNGKGLRDLNAGAPADKSYCGPALSPDGTRIAYVDGSKPPLDPPTDNSSWSSLVVANSDGTAARTIGAAYVFAPFCDHGLSWSPDGHTVAYFGGGVSLDAAGINTIDVDSVFPMPHRVAGEQNRDYFEVLWSPDGTRIAGSSDDAEMHVFSVDGSGTEVSTTNGYWCHPTSWSRDSLHLLVDCGRNPGYPDGISTLQANDLSNPQSLFPVGRDAAYSPDGSQIALWQAGGLYLAPADGSTAPTLAVPMDARGISWN